MYGKGGGGEKITFNKRKRKLNGFNKARAGRIDIFAQSPGATIALDTYTGANATHQKELTNTN